MEVGKYVYLPKWDRNGRDFIWIKKRIKSIYVSSDGQITYACFSKFANVPLPRLEYYQEQYEYGEFVEEENYDSMSEY